MLGSVADVTQILNAIEQGDPKTAAELLPLVYDELRTGNTRSLPSRISCFSSSVF